MIVNLLLISEEIGFQCSKVTFPKLEIGSVEIQTQTGPTTKLFFPQRHSDHQIILLQPIYSLSSMISLPTSARPLEIPDILCQW